MNPNWDERYSSKDFAYGAEPNTFFKERLQEFLPGSILMPADGEGRNGVYAATLGWDVTSLDLSKEGKRKALKLAEEYRVGIEYFVGDLNNLAFEQESFDAIGLIYAHFPADLKSPLHKRLSTYLKPGGVVIFEAFSKNHLPLSERNPEVGGPRDIDMLFSKEELLTDFKDFETLKLDEEMISLNEGNFHNGQSSVIRFVGKKFTKV